MSKQNRKMPSKTAIKNYWADRYQELGGNFDSKEEFMERDYCWACGADGLGGTERCHIVAHCRGGHDTESNLHLLCPACHKDSEFLEGDLYWEWLKKRTITDAMLSHTVRFKPKATIEALKAFIAIVNVLRAP